MNDAEILKTAKEVVSVEIEGLKALSESFDAHFALLAQRVMKLKGRLIITGMGKPGHIARKIAATLSSTGTPTFFLHPAEASHGDLGVLSTDDMLLMLSNSGESKELFEVIDYAKRFNIPLVGATAKPDSTLGRNSDILILIPDVPEACPLGKAPTTSTTMFLAFGDALAIALLHMRGFTNDHFLARHPGGKLGQNLLKVEDLMWKGDEYVPTCRAETAMPDVLHEMVKKNMGCVNVLDGEGRIAGIITDGDLKRCMDGAFMTKKAGQIMYSSPVTVHCDLSAAEALYIMNQRDITTLPVVDAENRPAGILHIHDLLRAKIA